MFNEENGWKVVVHEDEGGNCFFLGGIPAMPGCALERETVAECRANLISRWPLTSCVRADESEPCMAMCCTAFAEAISSGRIRRRTTPCQFPIMEMHP